jgi:hypothetical protein
MLAMSAETYEAELRARKIAHAGEVNPAPRLRQTRRLPLKATFRDAMARLGDFLINVGCELEIRYIADGSPTPCAS